MRLSSFFSLGTRQKTGGFTLAEVLVSSVILVVLAGGVYQSIMSLQTLVQSSKQKAQAIALANEQLEIIRNLPYSDVGLIDAWPPGKVPREQEISRLGNNFLVTTTIRSIDDPFDGQIGSSPNDLSPADYKLVEISISCPSCRYFEPVSIKTFVAPKALETSSGNGALFVRVIDSNGQPVTEAKVKVTNLATTSPLVVNDETNVDGVLALVDLPPAVAAYRVEVNKAGYSSAKTSALDETSTVTPENPDATVLAGQVSQITLVIDRLSSLRFEAINDSCLALGPLTFNLIGSRTTDKEETLPIYNQILNLPSSGNLDLILPSDTYRFYPRDNYLTISGSFPLSSFFAAPGANSIIKLLLTEKQPAGLLVAVKDGVSGLPLTGAEVTISGGGDSSQTLITSRGFFRDSDWSTGTWEGDGNIATADPAGELRLGQENNLYKPSGYLISQVLDAGTASTTFYQLVWQPTDQTSGTGEGDVRFQLAASDDPATTTWDFIGPDGTASSYYDKGHTDIGILFNNHRYLRYKVFLHTDDNTITPNISDISITYSSECLPFGQVFFKGIDLGSYTTQVTKTGYQTVSREVRVEEDWQILEIVLNPNV